MGRLPPPTPPARSVDSLARQRLRERLDTSMAKKKLRSTAQRRLIVDTFFDGGSHLTIEDVLRDVREHDKGIGYATVYRTLKLLAECGVAPERRFGDGLSRYELADDDDDHHDHLICTECGSLTEFEEPKIERLQESVAQRHGFRVTSHKHEMYGVCAKCQAAEKRAGSRVDLSGASSVQRPPRPIGPGRDFQQALESGCLCTLCTVAGRPLAASPLPANAVPSGP